MKRTIKLAVVAALALGATSAFATNGSAMIGMGAKTRGMGGAGIGVGHGAESALSNPALITTIKSNHEISFGGTLFMPNVEHTTGMGATAESDADFFVIPSVSVANKVNNNFYWGVGMWGTGGLGVDYRSEDSHMNMVTSLQNMQFGVPLVYTTNGFAIGITPIVQYTALDINYNGHMSSMGGPDEIGAGVADDVSIGYNLGMAYETQGITLGAVYKSEIESDIKDVLSTAVSAMGVAYDNHKISSPAEMGVGISYKMKEHTIALDYKMILWEDAETYKDFGWEDQDVIALGYEYATDKWALRTGYQYAKGAVQDNSNKNLALDAGGFGPGLTNMFNMLGFPGTQESHIALGGTYTFNETLSLDLAAVFGLENKETMPGMMGATLETKHSEQSYSVQLNYAF